MIGNSILGIINDWYTIGETILYLNYYLLIDKFQSFVRRLRKIIRLTKIFQKINK